MAMSKVTSNRGGGGGGGEGGSGFDVDRLLDFEKRTGVKDGEIDSFITKVDAVNAAIQAMKVRSSSHTGTLHRQLSKITPCGICLCSWMGLVRTRI